MPRGPTCPRPDPERAHARRSGGSKSGRHARRSGGSGGGSAGSSGTRSTCCVSSRDSLLWRHRSTRRRRRRKKRVMGGWAPPERWDPAPPLTESRRGGRGASARDGRGSACRRAVCGRDGARHRGTGARRGSVRERCSGDDSSHHSARRPRGRGSGASPP
jgi:hypothetical protein